LKFYVRVCNTTGQRVKREKGKRGKRELALDRGVSGILPDGSVSHASRQDAWVPLHRVSPGTANHPQHTQL